MSEATLNGAPLKRLTLTLPFAGIWHADALPIQDTLTTGAQTLVLAGVTYIGAIIREIDYAGQLMVRLVGGNGGWRAPVAAKQYGGSILGVPTSTIVQDVAAAAGERAVVLDASVPATVGPGFVRPAAPYPASFVLDVVLPFWWLDPSGVVQTAPRAATSIASQFVATEVQGAPGFVTIATESPGDWVPGATFASSTISGTINRVMHTMVGERLRTHVVLS